MDENEDYSEPEDLESEDENEPATKTNKIITKIKSTDDVDVSDGEYESDVDDEDVDAEEDFDEDMDADLGSAYDAADADVAKLNIAHFDDIEDDNDDDDEDDDENYLQKFDENLQKNVIADYHPEMISHNYSEIEVMSRVVRDENGVIIDPLHKTLPFITRYEKARILGERAKQINAGAKPFVDVPINMIDGYLIALKEFEEKKIPFILKRPLPGGGLEYWKFKDLEILI
jgi:DNA-directed RNA polymerase I, II, and III subunit RPABC2